MPTYRELLQAAKASVEEVDATRARELLDADDAPLLVDVRERDEWDEGHLPRAVHVPRGNLESRIERAVPDKTGLLPLTAAERAELTNTPRGNARLKVEGDRS